MANPSHHIIICIIFLIVHIILVQGISDVYTADVCYNKCTWCSSGEKIGTTGSGIYQLTLLCTLYQKTTVSVNKMLTGPK